MVINMLSEVKIINALTYWWCQLKSPWNFSKLVLHRLLRYKLTRKWVHFKIKMIMNGMF